MDDLIYAVRHKSGKWFTGNHSGYSAISEDHPKFFRKVHHAEASLNRAVKRGFPRADEWEIVAFALTHVATLTPKLNFK